MKPDTYDEVVAQRDSARAEAARMREAVEEAWKAGYELGHSDYDAGWPNRVEKAWLASKAKAALEDQR